MPTTRQASNRPRFWGSDILQPRLTWSLQSSDTVKFLRTEDSYGAFEVPSGDFTLVSRSSRGAFWVTDLDFRFWRFRRGFTAAGERYCEPESCSVRKAVRLRERRIAKDRRGLSRPLHG